MSNVLLVDTNFSSGPIYNFLKKIGHNVTVVGGNPTDALAKCVDGYVNLDYSDIQKTKKLIYERNIEYLIPGCNDLSYAVCAEINHDGRFPGIDSLDKTEIINNKKKFRAFSREYELPTPCAFSPADFGDRWPVIVKPVDAYSGRGITIIKECNKDELPSALAYAKQESRTRTCVVEDYVEGQLYSHTAFIEGGRVVVDFVVEEHGIANPFVVDTSRLVYNFPVSMLNSIRANIQLIAERLALKDGLVHTQLISNGDNYWLIEITRRCPGDLYSQLIELSTGINYAENYTRPFLGMQFNFEQYDKPKWIMRHTLTQPIEGVLGSLEFNEPVKLKKWVPTCLTGDKLGASPAGRIAIMFAEELNERDLVAKFDLAIKRKLYKVNR